MKTYQRISVLTFSMPLSGYSCCWGPPDQTRTRPHIRGGSKALISLLFVVLRGCQLTPQVNVGRVDVVEVSGCSITVASRKNLQLERYEAAAVAGADGCGGAGGSSSSVLWRLDQDEAASIGMHQRAAVLRLAADNNSANVQRLRELIIDSAAPRLRDVTQTSQQQPQQGGSTHAEPGKPAQPAGSDVAPSGSRAASPAAGPTEAAGIRPEPSEVAVLSGSEPIGAAARLAAASGESYLARQGSHLNSNQVAVLRRLMAMQDYCLVLGMPGKDNARAQNFALNAS